MSTQGVQPSHAERLVNLEKQMNVLKSYRAFGRPAAPYALPLEPSPTTGAKKGFGYDVPAIGGADGGAGSSDLRTRLANDERLIALLIHSLHRELANLSDLVGAAAKPAAFLRYDDAMASLSHLDLYRHLVRTSSREGILKLLSPVRDYWLLGGDGSRAGPGSASAGEAGDRQMAPSARLKRVKSFSRARHESDLILRLFEALDLQLQEMHATTDLLGSVDAGDPQPASTPAYTTMAAARSALDTYDARLDQVANICLLMEFLVFNDVNLVCLARVGASRLQALMGGLVRALAEALAKTGARGGSGKGSEWVKPRKTYLRCADILRFLAAVCRDDAISAALTRNPANLAAFMAFTKRARYPLLAVEWARVLRALFLGGAASLEPLTFSRDSSGPATVELCLRYYSGLPDALLELLGSSQTAGENWALQVLLAIRAMVAGLPELGLVDPGAARGLAAWARTGRSSTRRAALSCILALSAAPAAESEFAGAGLSRAAAEGTLRELDELASQDRAEGHIQAEGTYHSRDVWLSPLTRLDGALGAAERQDDRGLAGRIWTQYQRRRAEEVRQHRSDLLLGPSHHYGLTAYDAHAPYGSAEDNTIHQH